jgi:hypothetical protein
MGKSTKLMIQSRFTFLRIRWILPTTLKELQLPWNDEGGIWGGKCWPAERNSAFQDTPYSVAFLITCMQFSDCASIDEVKYHCRYMPNSSNGYEALRYQFQCSRKYEVVSVEREILWFLLKDTRFDSGLRLWLLFQYFNFHQSRKANAENINIL